jgi:hypothetical protein
LNCVNGFHAANAHDATSQPNREQARVRPLGTSFLYGTSYQRLTHTRVADIYHGDGLFGDVHRTDPVGDFNTLN